MGNMTIEQTLEIGTSSAQPGIKYDGGTKGFLALIPNWISVMPYNAFEQKSSTSEQMNVLLYLKRRRGNYYDRVLYVDGVMEVFGRLGVSRGDDTGYASNKPALVVNGGIDCYYDRGVGTGLRIFDSSGNLKTQLYGNGHILAAGLPKGKVEALTSYRTIGMIAADGGEGNQGWYRLRVYLG